jgi:ABC-type amino acid transport substrate-binding protein
VVAPSGSPSAAPSPAAGAAAATSGAPVSAAPILTAANAPAAVKDACQASKAPRIADIQKRGVLAWGIGISPPFGFKQPNGEWAGVEVDNAQELANILGVGKDTIQDFDYSLMTTALQSNQVDIVGAQLFVTPSRSEVIDFSVPYYLSGQVFYVLENSKWQTVDELNSPDNHFVYGTGGGQKDLAEKYIPKAQISDAPLRGQLILYEFLATRQADSTMGESAPLKVLKSQYRSPQLTAIGLKGRINGDRASDDEILDPFKVAFGLAKGDDGFKACVDAWVNEAKVSGRMQQRLDYWLAQNVAG